VRGGAADARAFERAVTAFNEDLPVLDMTDPAAWRDLPTPPDLESID